jgi:hypothetical protein
MKWSILFAFIAGTTGLVALTAIATTAHAEDKEGVSAKLMVITARRALPEGVPPLMNLLDNTGGFQLTFLVQGQHLADIKTSSMLVETLQIGDRDIRLVQGKENYRVGNLPPGTEQGKYGYFQLVSDEDLLETIDKVRVRGSIVVVIASGIETIETAPIDLTKRDKLELGKFKITFRGEAAPEPNPLAGLAKAFGEPDEDAHVALTVQGDVDEIAGLEVKVDGKSLNWRSRFTTDSQADYSFAKGGNNKGIVQISVWKDLREVRIPFSYNDGESGKIVPLPGQK